MHLGFSTLSVLNLEEVAMEILILDAYITTIMDFNNFQCIKYYFYVNPLTCYIGYKVIVSMYFALILDTGNFLVYHLVSFYSNL